MESEGSLEDHCLVNDILFVGFAFFLLLSFEIGSDNNESREVAEHEEPEEIRLNLSEVLECDIRLVKEVTCPKKHLEGCPQRAHELEGMAVLKPRNDSKQRIVSELGTQANFEMPDWTVLLPSPPDSCVEIVWGKSNPSPLKIIPFLDVYRCKYFELPHDLFLGIASDASVSGLRRYLICCVKRVDDDCGKCDGLFVGDGNGFTETRFCVSKRDDSRSTCVVSLLNDVRPKYTWSAAPSSSFSLLKLNLLGLEARLGPRRSFSVGVVFGTQNQWKEHDMFETAMSPLHAEFLKAIAGEDDEEKKFRTSGARLTTNFFGFEIAFHVAPLLSHDERRQFIGNDKVIIFCLEDGEKPFVPRFRGQVNSVGIVCQKKVGIAVGWKVAVFHKDRVVGLADAEFSGHFLELARLRKIVLTLAVNSHHAVMSSPPFDGMIARVLQDQLSQVWVDVLNRHDDTTTLSSNESLRRNVAVGKFTERRELRNGKWSVGKYAEKGAIGLHNGEAFPGVKLFSDRNSLDDVRTSSLRNSRNSLLVLASDSIFVKHLYECPPVDEDVPWFLRACVSAKMATAAIARLTTTPRPFSRARLRGVFCSTMAFRGCIHPGGSTDYCAG